MAITYRISKDQKPTEEQKREVSEAAKLPITYDDDSPELTEEMYEAFQEAARARNRRKNMPLQAMTN